MRFKIASHITYCSLISLASFFFCSCENDMKEVEALTKKSDLLPTESSSGLKVIFTDSGFIETRMLADQMDHYLLGVKDPYSEFTKGIYIENYNPLNKVIHTIKANYAKRFDSGRKMEEFEKFTIINDKGEKLNTEKHFWKLQMIAKDKVEIVNETGERLNTDELNMVDIDGMRYIYTHAYVEINTGKEIIKGTGMHANEDFTEWEINKVIGSIPVNEEEFK